jgi:hypothetical protein
MAPEEACDTPFAVRIRFISIKSAFNRLSKWRQRYAIVQDVSGNLGEEPKGKDSNASRYPRAEPVALFKTIQASLDLNPDVLAISCMP